MENLQLPIVWAMLCAYVGAFVLFGYTLIKNNDKVKKVALIVAFIGSVFNFLALVVRGILIKSMPLNNGMEFGMCFALVLMVIFFYLVKKLNMANIGVFVLLIASGLSMWIVGMDMSIHAINPSLRSYWLMFHVSTAIIAYGAFATSFALSISYLLKEKGWGKNLPAKEMLDEASYKMVFVGVPFLTIMLVTGAVWAEYAWGKFWSWDPKETFALVTWLVYAIYLHLRLMRGFKGRKTAIVSIVGFLAIMFTLFGVSYLLPGLHSYIG